jgi:Spy/CpxP family protein refolding chaperone
MKTLLLPLILVGALCATGLTTTARADDVPSSPPPAEGAHHGHHGGQLTPDEWAQLKKDREAVFAANPALKTEEEALHQQMKDHMDKVDSAILAQDPTAAPILAKLQAGHHHGPPPDDNGGQ